MTNKEIIEKLAEKEIKSWFRQWCDDEYSDIEEYFKSIWIEGYQKALSLQKEEFEEMIDEIRLHKCVEKDCGWNDALNYFAEELKSKLKEKTR